MSTPEIVALLLAAIGPMLAAARLVRVPDTLLLFGAGLAAALVPGLPPLRIDPQLMLTLFLPPVIYAATVRVSYHLLRFTLLSGVLFGIALALATIAASSLVSAWLLPGLSWQAALLLGTVVSVFDTRLFHEAEGRPNVPRAIADALKTREMVTRVVVLAAFALAIEAATEEPPGLLEALGALVHELAGGAVVGILLGRAVVWVRERTEPAPVEIAVSIATPYLAALSAEWLGLSTVVVIMSAALVISAERIVARTGTPRTSSEARINAVAFWEEVSLILSAILFFLAGRALPDAMAALGSWPLWWLAAAASGLLATVLAVQLLGSLLAVKLSPPAEALGTAADRDPGGTAAAAVMAWASTRSIIGLVLALSIPDALADGRSFADRDLILVVAALTIVGSVLLQGLTLHVVVRRAGLVDRGEEAREERNAAAAALASGEAAVASDAGSRFDAERRAVLALRARNRIGDEVLRKMLRETDLRQRSAEASALPGAGPPNP